MSPIAIVVLALALAVARRLARLALRIVVLIAVIAVLVSNGAHAARRNRRTVPRTPTAERSLIASDQRNSPTAEDHPQPGTAIVPTRR